MAQIRKYQTPDGEVPFDKWMNGLRDVRAKAKILTRLNRLELDLEGDWKSVGGGVFELRVSEGQGYRVYFAREGHSVVLLLCAGDKRSQQRDIQRAKGYWQDYRRQK